MASVLYQAVSPLPGPRREDRQLKQASPYCHSQRLVRAHWSEPLPTVLVRSSSPSQSALPRRRFWFPRERRNSSSELTTPYLSTTGGGYTVAVNGNPVTVLPTSMPCNWLPATP